MRNLLILVLPVCFFSLFLSAPSFALDHLSEAELKQKGLEFVAAKNARQRLDSSVEDIEYYLSLLSESFIDEYVHYKVTFSADKTKLRARLIEKMKLQSLENQVQLQQMMVGPNLVVLKLLEKGKIKPAGQSQALDIDRLSVISLEFNQNGLISHIRRHGESL
ncbi:hypothetical protein L2719_14935 [Shewanella schlegeliana]|uniref:Nuclear transport factor 2 family protein n=1 Tax=Shewanella schlegeliana TaxID=190308 RepID=A0ABS1T025_9GAMM|nr:hypothetical protein [Shewanella schlegeliana]MBL4914133.1 hypothetical protein [Shewanella schlegeliana]MCL1110830.1 hypothetical protein [Shewanella schlegeliana]GIU36346.1 hypothetical protein TUM4433_34960 [Shewanella schlegeliana]